MCDVPLQVTDHERTSTLGKLDDATVSRHHVEFRLENGQFLLVDLDSLNNTYVNHEPIDSAALVDGDEIQIGTFRLVFLTRPTTG